jgi:uncharacterized protein (TIGR02611 family)
MTVPMSEPVHRRDVWGDDPEERDASAVVEELLAEPGIERRWHDHPSIVWTKAVGRFIQRSGKRIAVTVAGFVLLIVAALIIPVPGPWSILLAIVALSILASEYVWARRTLAFAKRKADQVRGAVQQRRTDRVDTAADSSPTPSPSTDEVA